MYFLHKNAYKIGKWRKYILYVDYKTNVLKYVK